MKAKEWGQGNLGRWGNGNTEVMLASQADLPYVMGHVRQAFERQVGSEM